MMATAGLYEHMATSSVLADAIALGIRVGIRSSGVQPICTEFAQRAEEYLAEESERVRSDPMSREAVEELKTIADQDGWQTEDDTLEKFRAAVLELEGIFDQVAEENQFIWWLNIQRSPILSARRTTLKPKAYALVAAKEAAERVKILPPPSSALSILEEVLCQCMKGAETPCTFDDLLNSQNTHKIVLPVKAPAASILCTLSGALAKVQPSKTLNANSLEILGNKSSTTPTAAAKAFFNELVFMSALENLS